MIYRTLFEMQGAGPEGGEYDFLFGDVEISANRMHFDMDIDFPELEPPFDNIQSLFLADVHPAVLAALTTTDTGFSVDGDALGIVETSASATAIVAADTGVKAAAVNLLALRLSDGLGGKACRLRPLQATMQSAPASTPVVLVGIRCCSMRRGRDGINRS